jgi:1-acyl-sn-glycerol-3-phosphate acyltransferase
VVIGILYRWYFRAHCIGIEKLPPNPVLLVANHGSHSLSWDGANILSACLLEAETPRLVRPMANHRLMTLPCIGWAARCIGAVDGQRSLCIDLLRSGATVLAFPEGTDALKKSFRRRYELAPFHQGFMHVALATGVPIVPIAVIGSEEEAPLLFNATRLARLLRTPVAPITPTLMVPLPVRYRLHFGTPMHFNGLETPSEVTQAVELVRSALHALLQEGLRARRHWTRDWKSTFPFRI